MSKTAAPTVDLGHADWCPRARVETTDWPDRGITTTHCLDCGAHVATDRAGKTLATPAVTGGFASDRAWDDGVTMRSTGGDAA